MENPSQWTRECEVAHEYSAINGDICDISTLDVSAPPHQDAYAIAWLLWKNRRFIFRLTAIGLAASLLIALAIPSRYTATAQLMPPDAVGGGTMGMAAMAAGMTDKAGGFGTAAADLLGFKSSGALFVGILKSRTVEDRLVDMFDLRKVYGCRYRVHARKVLGERTDISEDRKSGVITIEVTDRKRDRAQQMAKAYVDELNRVVSASAMSSAARERSFIEARMGEVKKEMDASARALAEFSSNSNAIDLKEQAKAMVDAVATVQGQLIAAQSEMKALQAIYTEDNFRIRSARAQIAELNRQLKALDGDAISAKRENGPEYPTIRQLPGLGVTYEDLYRRNRIATAVYEALVQQFELSKIQEAKDTPKVQMLDAPEVPEVKSFPPRVPIVMGCLALSLLFACGWVIAVDQWCTVEESNPGKRLAYEITGAVHRHPIWSSSQVLKLRAMSSSMARRWKGLAVRRNESSNPAGAD